MNQASIGFENLVDLVTISNYMVGPFPNNELLESIAMCKLCWQKKTIFRQYNELERDY